MKKKELAVPTMVALTLLAPRRGGERSGMRFWSLYRVERESLETFIESKALELVYRI